MAYWQTHGESSGDRNTDRWSRRAFIFLALVLFAFFLSEVL